MTSSDSTTVAKTSSSSWRVYLMLAACMALWGGTWPVGKVVAVSLSPWNAALMRFLMSTAVLVPACFLSAGRSALHIRRGMLPRLLLLGATGIFGYSAFFFAGLKRIDAGRAALIVGCIPVCIALGSSALGRRLPRGVAVAGILLSLSGVSVVVTNGNPLALLHESLEFGDVMILGCVLCWTTYTLCGRPVMKEVSPLVAVTWSCIFGTLLLLPFALADGLLADIAKAGAAEWAGLAYLGFAATGIAYYAYYRAIQHVGATASGIFINLVPLFGVLLSCIFLDEVLLLSQVVGGVMVVSGVVVTVRGGTGRQ